MKKWLVFALIAMVAGSAMAQVSWVGDSYLFISGGAWYTAAAGGDGTNDGLPVSLALTEGDQIGFQTQLYPAGMGYSAQVGYALDGAWVAPINLGWKEDRVNNGVWESQSAEQMIPVTAGMDGQELEFYYAAVDDSTAGQIAWDNNGNANYSTTLAVTPSIPEPATMSLLGLGALAMVLRRKLRK
ncbi:MAG: PEP-CTERM sorting domain-containing protein [Verrucomicrobiota bacterium]|jgi:hypothetical protein|nr:PEP-CTERM sorting domain-containing protein [Verrucomicrobiota bacterium]